MELKEFKAGKVNIVYDREEKAYEISDSDNPSRKLKGRMLDISVNNAQILGSENGVQILLKRGLLGCKSKASKIVDCVQIKKEGGD